MIWSTDATATPSAARLVVLDACVLMPTILRRLLLRLARAGCFAPVWNEKIGNEWRRNAARLWEVPIDELHAEWNAMNTAFPDADAGDCTPYEVGLRYSDPKDWHVIAAGLAKRARSGLAVNPEVTVMTWNLKDFNRSELKRQALMVGSPDALLSQWFSQAPDAFRPSLSTLLQDASLVGRPSATVTQALHRERLFRLVNLVQAHGITDYDCLPETLPHSGAQ